MAQVPTIEVYRKSDGKQIIVNQADFDSAKHSKKPVADEPAPEPQGATAYSRKRKTKAK